MTQSSKKKLTAAQQSRLSLIQPLLDAQPRSITDRSCRLSIAKEIVLAHHGTIRVTSQVGEGSIFTVDLPYCPPNESET